MIHPNNIEKYIYKFLIKLHSKDYFSAFNYLQNKYNLEENYIASIIEECINSKYVDGISSLNSITNYKQLNVKTYTYVTRKGYQFINEYRLKKINIFWIPFKNLIIIIITAIITAIATKYFSK